MITALSGRYRHHGKYNMGEYHLVRIVREGFPKKVGFELRFVDCVFPVKGEVKIFL